MVDGGGGGGGGGKGTNTILQKSSAYVKLGRKHAFTNASLSCIKTWSKTFIDTSLYSCTRHSWLHAQIIN